jgi:hypothetical protein
MQSANRPLAMFGWTPALILLALILGCATARSVYAQSPPRVNYLHHEFMPPGAIAQEQLRRHAGMAGYYQAVELIPPEGTRISILQHGNAQPTGSGRVIVGMQLGYVYSIKLSQLPNREGIEVFPTIEIINRIYPPEGTKTRFPIPIEITEEDISQALGGLFVTRVVYLEDSDQAFPRADDPQRQRSIDVSPSEDPLHVADRMGRPMAIVRLGSRVPDQDECAQLASPPVHIYPAPKADRTAEVKDAIERFGQDVPRDGAENEPRGAFLVPAWRFLR